MYIAETGWPTVRLSLGLFYVPLDTFPTEIFRRRKCQQRCIWRLCGRSSNLYGYLRLPSKYRWSPLFLLRGKYIMSRYSTTNDFSKVLRRRMEGADHVVWIVDFFFADTLSTRILFSVELKYVPTPDFRLLWLTWYIGLVGSLQCRVSSYQIVVIPRR